MSTPQRFTFSSRGNIHAIWCVPKENYNNCDVNRYSHADLAEAFHVIPRGDLRLLRFATNLSTLPINDFYHSTGECSKYRKSLTYKVCDAVHTCPPQIARPVYVNASKFLPIYVLARSGVDRALLYLNLDVTSKSSGAQLYVFLVYQVIVPICYLVLNKHIHVIADAMCRLSELCLNKIKCSLKTTGVSSRGLNST